MRVFIGTDISQAVSAISEGRVVGIPTGTSYGLAVDALQGNALQRLRNLKKRPQEKTFTVFVRKDLWDLYFDLSHDERAILGTYDNSALTLLATPREKLSHLAQDGRVGLRVIDHPLMQQLADAVDVPLTATSANVSGMEPCCDAECVAKSFPWNIDETTYDLSLGYVLDGGVLASGRRSTIVRLNQDGVAVVREGSFMISHTADSVAPNINTEKTNAASEPKTGNT